MGVYAFNTLEQAENLQKFGFSEIQAKGLVEVIALSTSNLATKQDIEQIKIALHSDFQKEYHHIRQEFGEFKIETQREFSNIHLALAKLDNKILSMTISLGVVMVGALGGYTYLLQWLN